MAAVSRPLPRRRRLRRTKRPAPVRRRAKPDRHDRRSAHVAHTIATCSTRRPARVSPLDRPPRPAPRGLHDQRARGAWPVTTSQAGRASDALPRRVPWAIVLADAHGARLARRSRLKNARRGSSSLRPRRAAFVSTGAASRAGTRPPPFLRMLRPQCRRAFGAAAVQLGRGVEAGASVHRAFAWQVQCPPRAGAGVRRRRATDHRAGRSQESLRATSDQRRFFPPFATAEASP